MPNKCKRESWDTEETKYLLRLIREQQVLKCLDGKRFRAEEIFQNLESPMHQRGYLKSARQMQIRFKTLRFQFNQYKRRMGVSGEANRRKECPFYAEMEILLGDRPVATLEGIDSAGSSTHSKTSNSHELSLSATSGQSDEVDDSLEENSNDESAGVVNESVEVILGSSNTDEVASPATSVNDVPKIEENTTPSRRHRVRRGRKSTEKTLEKFAELCQQNALQRQNASADRQENVIAQLFEKQRDFEQELMTQFFEKQSQIMKETTSSLLHGLRGLFQPQYPQYPQYPQGPSRHGQGCQCPECLK